MRKLFSDYAQNVKYFDNKLSVSENFDVIKKILKVGGGELSLYYIVFNTARDFPSFLFFY